GGLLDGAVVVAVHLDDAGPLPGDGLDGPRIQDRRLDDPRPKPPELRHPGHRPTVVAVGRGYKLNGRRGARLAWRTERPVDRPERPERLEGRQPQPRRLVLDERPPDTKLGGD